LEGEKRVNGSRTVATKKKKKTKQEEKKKKKLVGMRVGRIIAPIEGEGVR